MPFSESWAIFISIGTWFNRIVIILSPSLPLNNKIMLMMRKMLIEYWNSRDSERIWECYVGMVSWVHRD